MYLTVTLNPAMDYKIYMNNIRINSVNLSEINNISLGGKGVNVSLLLNNLGIESYATGFIGRDYYSEIDKISKETENIKNEFFIENGLKTRVNVKIITNSGETEINSKGFDDFDYKVDDFIKWFKNFLIDKKIKFVFLSGSIPKGLDNDFYVRIAKILNELNIEFSIDTSRAYVQDVIGYEPFVYKPNLDELEDFFCTKIQNEEELIERGTSLRWRGVKNILISLGEKGAILISDNIYKFNGVKGDVIDTIGAGDSMLAGFVSKYMETENIEEAFRYSCATGTATAFSDGIAKEDTINEILDKIEIIKIA